MPSVSPPDRPEDRPVASESDAVIAAVGVHMRYGAGAAANIVLHGVDLAVAPGQFVALMGPSGSGKSTLLNLLGLLDTPTGGEVFIDGKSTAGRSRRALARLRNRYLGYVFQAYNLLAGLTVIENTVLPAVLAGVRSSEYHRRATELLERVELGDLHGRYPAELSGGQQQRVAIARALIMRPVVLLADEPTGNLDSRSSAIVMDLLHGFHRQGQAIVLVTHDNSIAGQSERLVTFEDGRIVTDSAWEEGFAWRRRLRKSEGSS